MRESKWVREMEREGERDRVGESNKKGQTRCGQTIKEYSSMHGPENRGGSASAAVPSPGPSTFPHFPSCSLTAVWRAVSGCLRAWKLCPDRDGEVNLPWGSPSTPKGRGKRPRGEAGENHPPP